MIELTRLIIDYENKNIENKIIDLYPNCDDCDIEINTIYQELEHERGILKTITVEFKEDMSFNYFHVNSVGVRREKLDE